MKASTSFLSSESPRSAMSFLWAPSNPNGFVTIAMTSAPTSFPILEMTADAPVPVPPPMPQVMNTISDPCNDS